MKQSFLFLFFFCIAVCSLKAQEYKSAVGLRLGNPISISYKQFVGEKAAIEVFAGRRGYSFYNYTTVGGLFLLHKPIEKVDGLSWYYGGGAGVYFFKFDDGFFGTEDSDLGIGILGALGLDYKFADYPVNLSLDWLPGFRLNGYGNGFGGDNGALAIRYTLGGSK